MLVDPSAAASGGAGVVPNPNPLTNLNLAAISVNEKGNASDSEDTKLAPEEEEALRKNAGATP